MKINYIFRSKEYKAFSIENVFKYVSDEINKKEHVEFSYLPIAKYSMKMFIRNWIYSIRLKGDILHITGDVHYISLIMPRKRTILTVHDIRAIEFLKNKKLKLLIYKMLWVVLPSIKCKYITTISEKSKEEFCEIVPWAKNKIRVIPNPIDNELKYTPKDFDVNKPRLLMIGTKENKNHMRMLEAIKDINCIVDIIGGLPKEEEEFLLNNKICFENSYGLSDEEIKNKYIISDIIMFASTYEGFGMPIIEAQAVGRCVITSDIEPMNSVASSGAILVDPYNIESIKDAVINIIENKDIRQQIVLKGLENAKKYTQENVGKQYLELYNEIYLKNKSK